MKLCNSLSQFIYLYCVYLLRNFHIICIHFNWTLCQTQKELFKPIAYTFKRYNMQKHKMMKSWRQLWTFIFEFLRKMWQKSFYDIVHMCTDVSKIIKRDLTSSQQMCNTQTGVNVSFMPVPSPFLFTNVPSSPSFFVLRMVFNECTYRDPHVLSLLMLQFASLNEQKSERVFISNFQMLRRGWI